MNNRDAHSKSTFVHYFGDIISGDHSIGEAHLHADGTIELLIEKLPQDRTALLHPTQECNNAYVITHSLRSPTPSTDLIIGNGFREADLVRLAFSSFEPTDTPCVMRLKQT